MPFQRHARNIETSQEHVRKLEQGVVAWNDWRRTNPNIRPTLAVAELTGAKLAGVDFSDANLEGAHLSRATLAGADLMGANLIGADLRWADFTTAYLNGALLGFAALYGTEFNTAQLDDANLEGAVLSEANLIFANLMRADLRRADLNAANLRGAIIGETLFIDTNLRAAKGLESCQHERPSVIDHRTLAQSGTLPLSFLRGCGLPDSFIEALLLNRGAGFYSCFISYSTSDQEFANRLFSDLQTNGVRCWFAPHHMQRGKKIHEQIDEAIRCHDKLLLILSRDSMASNWVKTEIANARSREQMEGIRMLFPISIVPYEEIRGWTCFDADTGIDTAREIREYLVANFDKWKERDAYANEFEALLRSLKMENHD
jgi:hypothetical protein